MLATIFESPDKLWYRDYRFIEIQEAYTIKFFEEYEKLERRR